MYFLNIYKPKGITSFDCIRKLRKRLNIKAIGHSGTLDPLASGVMQVGVGNATKLLDYLKSDKTYIADIMFGYSSDTMDDEGNKEFIKEPDFDKKTLIDCLNSFVGISMQTPPKYSAIKKNGVKLCDIARKNPNEKIDIAKRQIEIYSIELLEFDKNSAKILVNCKKGTYIRSLANDIGKKLSCGAYIKDLTRIKAGTFDIKNSNNIDGDLIPINPLDVLDYEKYELNDDEFTKVKNGNSIYTKEKYNGNIILLTKNKKLVSIAILSDNQDVGVEIKPKKVFNEV